MKLRSAGRANDRTAALHHVGRKSGRLYVTPLAAEPVVGGFIIPLVYGDDTDWCRNLLAASQGTLELRGESISILNPRVVELATVQDQVRAAQVKTWMRLGIRRLLRVGTHSGIANPSPCVDSRTITKVSNTQYKVTFEILYLSDDGGFARK